MDNATLEAELKSLATRCEPSHPAVAACLFGILGALACGLETELSRHQAIWSRMIIGQLEQARGMIRILRN